MQRAVFDSEVEQARKIGIARSANAAPSPVHGVAVHAFSVPIRDAQGNMVMALTVAARAERLSPDPRGDVPKQLAQAAAQIERRLQETPETSSFDAIDTEVSRFALRSDS